MLVSTLDPWDIPTYVCHVMHVCITDKRPNSTSYEYSVKFRNGRNVHFLFQTIYNIKMTRSRDNSNLKTLLKTHYGTNKKRYQCKCVHLPMSQLLC